MTTIVQNEENKKDLQTQELLEKCERTFREAESAIKTGELSIMTSDISSLPDYHGLFLPAINELRYAGRHIGDFALSNHIEDLYEAIFHCLRAKSAAYDCLIQYRLSDIRLFMEQYKSLIIGEVVPDYPSILLRVNEIARRSMDGVQENDTKDQLDIDIRVKDYKVLDEIYKELEACREVLNQKLKKEERRRQNLFSMLAIVVATLTAMVVTIIIVL